VLVHNTSSERGIRHVGEKTVANHLTVWFWNYLPTAVVHAKYQITLRTDLDKFMKRIVSHGACARRRASTEVPASPVHKGLQPSANINMKHVIIHTQEAGT